MKKNLSIILLTLIVPCLYACAPQQKIPLVVFAAGSLIQPFSDLEQAFEKKYPEIDVLSEYHGSIQVMRHVTELHEEIDVVATADQSLIPLLMYDVNVPETEQPYATWYITMASNQLGIAYRPESKYADEITAENWYKILSREDVRVGLADPRFDAVGYRTLMVFALAEDVYTSKDIFFDFLHGQFKNPIKLVDLDNIRMVRVPEILETSKESHILLRGSSIQLISLLEAGEVDYAFEYESVIHQNGFEMLELPDNLNLGEAELNEFYGKATVQMDFQRFASVNPVFQGEQIKYGITIPTNAPNPNEAALYIQFLFSPEGLAIMQQNAHPLLIPILVDHVENLPESLQSILEIK
jgi:molybdate/tungstate transport system substrate-binding protein